MTTTTISVNATPIQPVVQEDEVPLMLIIFVCFIMMLLYSGSVKW